MENVSYCITTSGTTRVVPIKQFWHEIKIRLGKDVFGRVFLKIEKDLKEGSTLIVGDSEFSIVHN